MGRIAHMTLRKAGSQWVSNVLSDLRVLAYVPQVKLLRPSSAVFQLPDWVDLDDGVFAGPLPLLSFGEWSLISRPGDKAICVSRDPRDAIVSWVFSATYSHVTSALFEVMRPILLSLDLRRKLLLAMYINQGAILKTHTWAARVETESEFPTTYERLVEDEVGEFGAIIRFLDWQVPADVVREVTQSHSFRQRSGGRERGTSNTFSHYRRGMPGDWRNYFDRQLGDLFEKFLPRVVRELGYERSDRWFDELPEQVEALVDDDATLLETLRAHGSSRIGAAEILAKLGNLSEELYELSKLE